MNVFAPRFKRNPLDFKVPLENDTQYETQQNTETRKNKNLPYSFYPRAIEKLH